MARPLYLPTPRQGAVLVALALLSIGHAMVARYLAMEQTSVSLACNAGAQTWLCLSRNVALVLHSPPIFGITALIVSLLNLMRPSVVLFGIALVAAGHGLVLYNTTLSALAVAALILSLARPAPEPE